MVDNEDAPSQPKRPGVVGGLFSIVMGVGALAAAGISVLVGLFFGSGHAASGPSTDPGRAFRIAVVLGLLGFFLVLSGIGALVRRAIGRIRK